MRELCKFIHVKSLENRQAQSKCSINISFNINIFLKNKQQLDATGGPDLSLGKILSKGNLAGIRPSEGAMLCMQTQMSPRRGGSINMFSSFFSCLIEARVLRKGSSAGKESACSAGDHGSISRSGSSPGVGKATHSSILGLPWWLRL